MPEETEDLELLGSGRIRAVIGGKTYTLRRPNMGQLRAFRESFTDLAEEMAELVRTKHPTVVLAKEGHEVSVSEAGGEWSARCSDCDAAAPQVTPDRGAQDRWAVEHRNSTVDDERKAVVHKEWRQANVDYIDHVVAWVHSAFSALAEPSLNGLLADDLPAWAGEQETINAIFKHWRERPFNSGGQ